MAKKRKKKRTGKVVLAALIVAVLLLVVVMVNRSGDRGDRVLAAAITQLAGTQTLEARANLVINLPERLRDQKRPLTRIEVMVEGDVSRDEEGVPELTGTLLAEARGTGNALFAEGEARIMRDDVLFNLEEFPVLLNPSGSLVERWTSVAEPLLVTSNPEAVGEMFESLTGSFAVEGKERVGGVRAVHLTGSLTEADEERLVEVLRSEASGNKALDVIARLLMANKVAALDVWVDPDTSELVKVQADFVRPLANGDNFDFATLELAFTNYGKPVSIDRPEVELTVESSVFTGLFGAGEVKAIEK